MGLSLFKNCSAYGTRKVYAPNPDPANFEILKTVQVGNAVCATIRYPDCTNFEGKKICVYANTTEKELLARTNLDPHFTKGDESPIARFKPTKKGTALAMFVARQL